MRIKSPDSSAPEWLSLFVLVVAVALPLRLLQWWLQQGDPLFWNPLGGNVPYLRLGERIAEGEWLPLDGRPFTVSSPLYPWIVGFAFWIAGEADVGMVRLLGAVADAFTCGLLALLADRAFGRTAAWATGLMAALYAPLIHFSVELAPVPFTLLLLVGGLLAVQRGLDEDEPSPLLVPLGGLLIGLAVGTRPNLLLGAVLLPVIPWSRKALQADRPRRLRAAGLLTTGLALGMAPVPLLNVWSSGEPVLLTTGAGHNFYIGHNPDAQPQYSLPLALDGDIFESMKGLAEEAEGRSLEDTEVSGWYLRRALRSMREDPARELALLRDRLLLSVNDFEATTYSNIEYQRHFSPLLRVLPGFGLLFGLALIGLAVLPLQREQLLLWLPAIAGLASVLLFFYIARLRILMVPTLLLLAGPGIAGLLSLVRRRALRATGLLAALGLAGVLLASLPLLRSDASNEWNKAAGVLLLAGFATEAEEFLGRALDANPSNPDSWRNLAHLYRETGRPDEAAEAEARASVLLGKAAGDRDSYGDRLGVP